MCPQIPKLDVMFVAARRPRWNTPRADRCLCCAAVCVCGALILSGFNSADRYTLGFIDVLAEAGLSPAGCALFGKPVHRFGDLGRIFLLEEVLARQHGCVVQPGGQLRLHAVAAP